MNIKTGLKIETKHQTLGSFAKIYHKFDVFLRAEILNLFFLTFFFKNKYVFLFTEIKSVNLNYDRSMQSIYHYFFYLNDQNLCWELKFTLHCLMFILYALTFIYRFAAITVSHTQILYFSCLTCCFVKSQAIFFFKLFVNS